ncbi:MAG TPA: response regulator [Tepidisphaeraceae bacterium]|nr:response regulator [Tepidisphaeraceae bacterium]
MRQILIVEDEKDSREVLAEFLREHDFGVKCTPSGREAIAAMIESPPDLVVVDLFMPEMDGAGLLEVIRSYLRLQSLPVVVWTGVDDRSLISRACQFRVNKVVTKARSTLDDVLAAIVESLPPVAA